ncbi:amidohydrolase [Allosphingosinicella indica]|uniref:Hippurate hydrolase n=1 Tax=Allosphingosinicella indica TaxID=941907 RepID=A0A1X7FZD9_9SPHN|nr:amidohydrolase [Allosphingosinicella indica]SMF61490.1 hippurate hydrolase [Allosphingosinicella indica]
MRFPVLFALAAGLAAPAYAAPDYAPAIKADYDKRLGALFDWFHRNPELSFKETKTAARMAKELKAIPGMQVTEGVGGTGVVGVLKNGAGPTVLVRADMDGLPVEEKSGLANASKVRQVGIDGVENPVMHACGHDVHITSLVGTATQLAAMKDRWKGTIVFIVQPAEERVAGAKAMLDDGLYTRFPKPDYALAFHVASNLETGKISASEGIQYSSADSVDITVHGVGAHGASPHTGKDPVYIGSQIVMALQGIISRERQPLDPGVITVGAFHAGSKHNIISDRADLQLTVRANNEETRAYLLKAIARVAEGVGRTNGLPEDKLPTVKVSEGTPTTINDTALAQRLNAALIRDLGADSFKPFEQTGMGAEDFSYLVARDQGVPGYYFAVGGTPKAAFDAAEAGGPPVPSHHSPLFKIDPEPSVILGTKAMTAAVLDLMKPGATASGAGN